MISIYKIFLEGPLLIHKYTYVKVEDPLYTYSYVFSHLWRNLIRLFLLRWFYCLQIHKRMFTCIVHGNWHGKLHCHSTLQIEKQSNKNTYYIRKNFKNYWFFHLLSQKIAKVTNMAVFSEFSEHYGIGTKKVTAMHHFNDHRSFLELLVIYCSRCEAAMWLLLTNSCQKKKNKNTISTNI